MIISCQSSYLSQISKIIFVEKKLSCEEILGNFEKFCEILRDFATIHALSCGEKMSPKSTFVGKKMTNMRSVSAGHLWKQPGSEYKLLIV